MESSIVNEDGKVFDSCEALFIFPNQSGTITLRQAETPVNNVYITIPLNQVEKVVAALRLAKREQLDML